MSVKIGDTTTTYLYKKDLSASLGDDGIEEARDASSSTYINPMLNFRGTIVRNSNTKAIMGIEYEVID